MKRSLLLCIVCGVASYSVSAAEQSAVDLWGAFIRPQYFQEREILVGKSVVELRIPLRAEDSGIVPVSVHAKIPQKPDYFIRQVYVFVDKNPKPLAGRFELTPAMGKADLAMRLRINEFTDVRVIAETSDGVLHMDAGYTRASGGCSEPPPFLKLKEARKRIGEMKLRTESASEGGDMALAHLLIRHPNITGMQLDQRTRAYIPAEYVTKVVVHFDGEHVMTAETDISISEDPSFRFFFQPHRGGVMTADMTDSKGRQFSRMFDVGEDFAVVER